MLTALLLCACGREEVDQAADQVADVAETVADEVRENVDKMADNATVDDGDGYIGEDAHGTEPTDEPTVAPTDADGDDDMTDNGGIFGTDAEDSTDHV